MEKLKFQNSRYQRLLIYMAPNCFRILFYTLQVVNLPTGISPVIIFINTKSGGLLGNLAIGKFSRSVNPLQIFDLSQGGPIHGYLFVLLVLLNRDRLNFIINNPSINFRIIACGGDGTASWVLSIMDQLKMKNVPVC